MKLNNFILLLSISYNQWSLYIAEIFRLTFHTQKNECFFEKSEEFRKINYLEYSVWLSLLFKKINSIRYMQMWKMFQA